jgi:steroid delta-isomerase-like uncharacterized protein
MSAQGMPREIVHKDNVALIRRWFEEVWNQGSEEAIDRMSASRVVGHGQVQHDKEIHGLDEFKPFVRSIRAAFPDIHITIHEAFEEDDKVVARWTAQMTHTGKFLGFPASGRKATISGMSMQRIVDGKIVEGWDNWDQLGLMVQIGALPLTKFA